MTKQTQDVFPIIDPGKTRASTVLLMMDISVPMDGIPIAELNQALLELALELQQEGDLPVGGHRRER